MLFRSKIHNFDKIFIFNSSLRYNLIARFSKIPQIYQYPLFEKTNQHITDTPKKFLKDELALEVNEDPEIEIEDTLINNSIQKFNMNKNQTNILSLDICQTYPSFFHFLTEATYQKNLFLHRRCLLIRWYQTEYSLEIPDLM